MEILSVDGQPMSPGLSQRHRTVQQEWTLQPDAPRAWNRAWDPGGYLVWPQHQPSRVGVRVRAEALHVPSSALPPCRGGKNHDPDTPSPESLL